MTGKGKAIKPLKGHQAPPSEAQMRYLRLGLDQPGGKLPLFDEYGQKISTRTIQSCMDAGWCEQWFHNPISPDWLVCKLTSDGRNRIKMIGGKA